MTACLLIAESTPMTQVHMAWIVAWGVVVAMLVGALVALAWTQWGRSQPLRICVVLSLLAHVLLAGYAATIHLAAARAAAELAAIEVTFGEPAYGLAEDRGERPWEDFPSSVDVTDSRPSESEDPTRPDAAPLPDVSDQLTQLNRVVVASQASESGVDRLVMTEITHRSRRIPRAIEVPKPQRHDSPQPSPGAPLDAERFQRDDRPTPTEQILLKIPESDAPRVALRTEMPRTSRPRPAPIPPGRPEATAVPRTPSLVRFRSEHGEASSEPAAGSHGESEPMPDVYKLRVAPRRAALARALGGSRKAEGAVEAGLRWLGTAQGRDGRWDARRWGGGRSGAASARDRQQAGTNADTGVTGLALLAFLGSGHTHQAKGPYRATVQHGLEFLLAQQARDGDLSGDARLFAAMYCHGMATFALCEAYAMTGDVRLRGPVERAVGYTLAVQNRSTGGWRYQRGDSGDTSQLGWQVMALKSAEHAGIPIHPRVRQGIRRYLDLASSGRYLGLASYRPGERVSHAMTAEALVCRHFLGGSAHDAGANEAAEFIMSDLPKPRAASGRPMNLYYWYYGALALHPRQDELWRRWNDAMQAALVETQKQEGGLAGSWEPTTTWGRYGGRVYTTAMATLCLEVYYRFGPAKTNRGGDAE